MTTIELERGKGYGDAGRAYRVELDGKPIGRIQAGESLTFEVLPGRHRLRLRIDWCGSNPLEFVVEDGQHLSFACGHNVPPFLELIYLIFLRNRYLWLRALDGPRMLDAGSDEADPEAP